MRKIYDLSIIRIRKNVFAFSEEYAEFLSKKKKTKTCRILQLLKRFPLKASKTTNLTAQFPRNNPARPIHHPVRFETNFIQDSRHRDGE